MSGAPENTDGHPIQGGEAGIGGMDQRAVFMDELSNMTPEQQQEFFSRVAQLPEEQRASLLNALGLAKSGGEARADRMEENPEVQAVADDQLQHDVLEASKRLVPGMEDTQREGHALIILDSYNKLTGETAPTQDEEAELRRFAEHIEGIGFRRGDEENVDANILRAFPNLTPEQREKIIAKLPEISDQDRVERGAVSEEEKNRMEAQANAMGQIIESTGNAANEAINGALQELPEEGGTPEQEERRAQLVAHQGRANALLGKFTDLFAEGEPGREWARRGGKTLYWTLMIAFILIIAELNMINKMAGQRK